MALGKMLRLGGMENSSPRADQSAARFRVARNVYQTPDNRIIPRYDYSAYPLMPTNFNYIYYYAQYRDPNAFPFPKLITAAHNPQTGTIQLINDTTPVPELSTAGGIGYIDAGLGDFSLSVMSYRKNNTIYFLNPNGGRLFKYDGVETTIMGSSQPRFGTAEYLQAGTKFVRVIQHRTDFDNNEPVSEYIQFPTSSASVILRTDSGATNIIGNTNVLPTVEISQGIGESPFFFGTASYSPGVGYTIAGTDNNITEASIGAYLFVTFSIKSGPSAGLGESSLGIALRIKSVSPLVLDETGVKYLSLLREWKTALSVDGTQMASFITYGTRDFYSIWDSTSATGAYFFRSMAPAFRESLVSHSFGSGTLTGAVGSFITADLMFTIAPILSDWYNPVTRKATPNSPDVALYGSYWFRGITAYQDLMILWNDQYVWFSDTSLGGSFEQLNLSNVLVIGDAEYGNIMSCVGTADFLVVSRERKNYIVQGTLETGNYKVSEIVEAEVGAWTNNALVNVKDSAILISAAGIFQIFSGGKCAKLSAQINKNFSRYDNYPLNEDISFSLIGTTIYGQVEADLGLSIAYDEYRQLLVIMKHGQVETNNPCLVINTSNGEFYEWEQLVTDPGYIASAIGSINGSFVIGRSQPIPDPVPEDEDPASPALTYMEDKTIALGYVPQSPVKLYSSWMTAGEPSLEKELLQLKFFGYVNSVYPGLAMKVVHFKDWDYQTKITDVEYITTATAFSHKKRLNSDKVLAASVGVEITEVGADFQIESFEVEFNPIQTGMKR